MRTLLCILLLVQTPRVGCLQMDVLLIADLSGSVQGQEPFIYAAMEEFVNKFELSEEGIKIGMITFNTNPTLVSHLSSDAEHLKYQLNQSVRVAGGETNLLNALIVAQDEFYTNGRVGYRQMIIVISDGNPDAPDKTTLHAEVMKSNGVNFCTILIKNPIANDEYMRALCSNGCYAETSFSSLAKELTKLDICL